jgi:putative addiction module component (TIGR02574 family)
MTPQPQRVYRDALELSPEERAQLIDLLFVSLSSESRDVDERWAAEAEDRIDAYERGEIRATPADEVFSRVLRDRS